MELVCGLLEYDCQIVTNNRSQLLDTTRTVTCSDCTARRTRRKQIWNLLITLFITNTRPAYSLFQILQLLMEKEINENQHIQ
jgi:hypothetical protein